MWLRAARWAIAALIGSAMTSVGCGKPAASTHRASGDRPPLVADDVVHAFDRDIELRLAERLALDNFLRYRDIHLAVADGVVTLTGEVWTAVERERAADVLLLVPGVIDVDNALTIRPPT